MRGLFHLKNGISDYHDWTEKLIEEFGSKIQSQLKYIRKWSVALKESAINGNYKVRLNCWQFMGCKFNNNFINIRMLNNNDSETCPVLFNEKYNGINNGLNAGRICWLVLNTRCYGYLQKDYCQKIMICSTCEFYNLVKEEESLTTDLYSELDRLSFLK